MVFLRMEDCRDYIEGFLLVYWDLRHQVLASQRTYLFQAALFFVTYTEFKVLLQPYNIPPHLIHMLAASAGEVVIF